MNKLLKLIICTFFLATKVFGQLCPPIGYPEPTANFNPMIACAEAPIFCNELDGYCNTLTNTLVNPACDIFPGCPSYVLNNTSWLAFVAGTTEISLLITATNCQGTPDGFGMQGAIVHDCFNPTPLAVHCPCTYGQFVLSANNFIVGETYHLLLDGCGGDICDYEISLLSGSTQNPNLNTPVEINGESEVCVGGNFDFEVNFIPIPFTSSWTIIPPIGNISYLSNTQISVDFHAIGETNLCFSAETNCVDSTIFVCKTIVSEPAPITNIELEFCLGECVECAGDFFCNPGLYPVILPNSQGCDSIVNCLLTPIIIPPTEQQIYLCLGESVEVCGNIITPTVDEQPFVEVCSSYQGCDSIIVAITNFINYEFQIDTFPNGNDLGCGIFTTNFIDPPFDLFSNFYYEDNDSIPFAGNIATICEKGLYCVEILDNNGSIYCNDCFYWGNPPDTTQVFITLCEGICVTYLNTEFCEPIDTLFELQNFMGEDSLVLLSINEFKSGHVLKNKKKSLT